MLFFSLRKKLHFLAYKILFYASVDIKWEWKNLSGCCFWLEDKQWETTEKLLYDLCSHSLPSYSSHPLLPPTPDLPGSPPLLSPSTLLLVLRTGLRFLLTILPYTVSWLCVLGDRSKLKRWYGPVHILERLVNKEIQNWVKVILKLNSSTKNKLTWLVLSKVV